MTSEVLVVEMVVPMIVVKTHLKYVNSIQTNGSLYLDDIPNQRLTLVLLFNLYYLGHIWCLVKDILCRKKWMDKSVYNIYT